VELKDAIRQSYLVQGLTDEEVQAIIGIAEQRTFTGGQTLMRQFEKSNDLMIVADGAARIITPSGEPLADLAPGSVFGEISFLDDAPRSATVISVRNTAVAVIPYTKLRELMQGNAHTELVILRNLSKVLCSHVRLANVQLEGMTHRR